MATLAGCSSSPTAEKTVSRVSDPEATPQTVELHRFLQSCCGRVTMFGHQDAALYGHDGWKYVDGRSDVKDVCGSHPAVFGWELGEIELGKDQSLDAVHFSKIREGIIAADKMGGINTISWHSTNPVTGKSAWDKAPGSIHKILYEEEFTRKYFACLDHIATFLLSLKDEQGEFVPVMFRPFHEHTGSWFWWGSDFCTPDEYKELWHRTVDYLRGKRGIHHVLYAYSPDRVSTPETYFERYPGDDYVDVIGLDCYHRGGEQTASEYMATAGRILDFMSVESARCNKPFVFSETGLNTLNMKKWFTEVLYPVVAKTHPAYVLVWRNPFDNAENFYGPFPGHESCADFISFKDKQDIVLLDELNGIRK